MRQRIVGAKGGAGRRQRIVRDPHRLLAAGGLAQRGGIVGLADQGLVRLRPRQCRRASPYALGFARGGVILSERGETFRSEEHTSELQSLMRISYAVFCLKKKTRTPEPDGN